jgi:hypothetical protein
MLLVDTPGIPEHRNSDE